MNVSASAIRGYTSRPHKSPHSGGGGGTPSALDGGRRLYVLQGSVSERRIDRTWYRWRPFSEVFKKIGVTGKISWRYGVQ
jgi:hypothetical protein